MKIRSNLLRLVMGICIAAFIFSVTDLAMAETFSDQKAAILDGKSMAIADGDTVVVGSEGANLSYDVIEIRAEAGSTLTIQYINRGDLPHNVVLVKQRSDINPVGIAGIQASETDYIPQDEANQEKIIAHTTLAKPGETVFVTFTVPPPGTYPYICTYAGHFTMMQGDLISE